MTENHLKSHYVWFLLIMKKMNTTFIPYIDAKSNWKWNEIHFSFRSLSKTISDNIEL